MNKRIRSLLPAQWPPASFSGALDDEPPPTPEDTGQFTVDLHDPLVRLEAVTRSSVWKVPVPPEVVQADDPDDDYEAMWMTPTLPIPIVRTKPAMPAVSATAAVDVSGGTAASEGRLATAADALEEAADEAAYDHVGPAFSADVELPSDNRSYDALPADLSHDTALPGEALPDAVSAAAFADYGGFSTYGGAENSDDLARTEPVIPLPVPQLPSETEPWPAPIGAEHEHADDPAADSAQRIVVMGPRTASLAFHGENHNTWENLRAALHRVVQAQEEASERAAQQMEDVSLQTLTQLALEVEYFEQQAVRNPKVALAGLQEVRAQLNAALKDAASALFSVRPLADGATSLLGALRRYALFINSHYSLPFEVQVPERELPLPYETVKLAFRIAQEAMLNAARHAHASLLLISVSFNAETLRLVIEDDGNGFDPQEAMRRAVQRGSGGLLGMLERAELLRAKLRIESVAGHGCVVELLIPLR